MGLIDRLRLPWRTVGKANPVVPLEQAGWDLAWGVPSSAVESATSDFYKTSVAVYACVRARADNIAGVPLVVYRNDEPVEPSDPLQSLLDKVNPFWPASKLWRATETSLCLWGSAFWALDRMGAKSGPPKEIWWLRPDRVKVVPDAREYISHFVYTVNGRELRFERDEMMWMAYHNPYSEFSGLSPLEASRLAIEGNTEALKWNRRFFDNDATPGRAYVKFPNNLTPEQAEEFQKRWKRLHSSPDRAHRLAILDSGAELATLGIPQRDMEFLALQRYTLEDICRVYRVPPPLVADLDRAYYSTYAEAKASFWHETLLPELQMFAEHVNEFLVPQFGDSYHVEFDISDVEALHEEETAKVTRYVQLVQSGILLINEVRERENLEPVPWGDSWWVPFTLSPASPSGGQPPPIEEPVGMAAKAYPHAPQESAFWGAYVKRLDGWAERFRRGLSKYFAAEEQDVLAKLESGQKQAAQRPNLFDKEEAARKLEQFAMPIIATIIDSEAADVIDAYSLAIRFDLSNPRVQQWLGARMKQFSADVSEATANAIAEALREGEMAGESIPDLAKRIEAVFDQARGPRAERIARTETLSASNRGALEAYAQSGVVSQKRWLATMDDRVRDAHADADGQTVGLEEMFCVGGESVSHPGEGSAANSVNCRCRVIPVMEPRRAAPPIVETRCLRCGKLLGKGLKDGEVSCVRCGYINAVGGNGQKPAPKPKRKRVVRRVQRDASGQIAGVIEEESEL